jgi:hypothetical protein
LQFKIAATPSNCGEVLVISAHMLFVKTCSKVKVAVIGAIRIQAAFLKAEGSETRRRWAVLNSSEEEGFGELRFPTA